MKNNLLKTMALAAVMPLFYACSVPNQEQQSIDLEQISSTIEQPIDEDVCVAQNPKTRITNNSSSVVNLEVFDEDGSVLNEVSGLNPGEISDWIDFPVGLTTFSVTTLVSVKKVEIFMSVCMAYEVTIDENHQLNTDVPIQF